MNKKALKKENNITMERFLRSYLKIDNEYIIDSLSRLTHRELKTVCREIYKLYIISIPFEEVELEDLYEGSIILVSDIHGNIAPYKNPNQKSIKDIHEEIDNYHVPKNYYFQKRQQMQEETRKLEDYEETIDLIEENLTIEDVNISNIGPFTIVKRKRRKLW